MAFFEDNFLLKDGLSHHGLSLDKDEEMSPSLEKIVMEKSHPQRSVNSGQGRGWGLGRGTIQVRESHAARGPAPSRSDGTPEQNGNRSLTGGMQHPADVHGISSAVAQILITAGRGRGRHFGKSGYQPNHNPTRPVLQQPGYLARDGTPEQNGNRSLTGGMQHPADVHGISSAVAQIRITDGRGRGRHFRKSGYQPSHNPTRPVSQQPGYHARGGIPERNWNRSLTDGKHHLADVHGISSAVAQIRTTNGHGRGRHFRKSGYQLNHNLTRPISQSLGHLAQGAGDWGRPNASRPYQGGRSRSQSRATVKNQDQSLNLNYLKELQKMNASKVQKILVEYIPQLGVLLTPKKDMDIDEEMVTVLCLTLCRACTTKSSDKWKKVLIMIRSSTFFRRSLPTILTKVGCHSSIEQMSGGLLEMLHSSLLLGHAVFTALPQASATEVSLLLASAESALRSLKAVGEPIPSETMSLARVLSEKLVTPLFQMRKGRQQSIYDSKLPPDNFRHLSVVPSAEELQYNTKPFLRKNVEEGCYPDAETYLDVQFRLLREDVVQPLREGIRELQNHETRRQQSMYVYKNVQITYYGITNVGRVHNVQFETCSLRHVCWDSSKRLIFGNLVSLSQDEFKSAIFGIVAERDASKLKKGKVTIKFFPEALQELSRMRLTRAVFLMVESPSFFEPYCYVLKGLQETHSESLPFKSYIVDCSTDIRPPLHLAQHQELDFSPLLGNRSLPFSKTMVKALDSATWPSEEKLCLDSSQMKALQAALTQEIAIIQGPPGTGKTHVGLKIAKILIAESVKRHLSPMLIVCYTNHALDQFLEGIWKFCKNGLVRIGSRSESEELKPCMLSELRHSIKGRTYHNNVYSEAVVDRHHLGEELKAVERNLMNLNKRVFTFSTLQEFILGHQQIQIIEINKVLNTCCFLDWLGLGPNSLWFMPPHGIDSDLTWCEVDDGHDEFLQHCEGSFEAVIPLLEMPRSFPDLHNETVQVFDEEEVLQNEEMADHFEDSIAKLQDFSEILGTCYQQVKFEKNTRVAEMVRVALKKAKPLTLLEEGSVWNIWQMSYLNRWRLYSAWLTRFKDNLLQRRSMLEQRVEETAAVIKTCNEERDLFILRGAKVIGMTTTGAAKHRNLLQQLKPRIIIVEEAAEVLEAHVFTALNSECQHLILIGDHQQLRPNPTVYELAKDYHLDLSLFERMVKNNIPYVTLNTQHRMRPEIATLIVPHIYKQLNNHPSVSKFENIKGLATNLFFVEHEEPEKGVEDTKSHNNPHEARFVVELCRYLLKQGYEPTQVTILTTYTGQLLALKKLMPMDSFKGVHVCVVDKYQGEENDIVLLSLVRSNKRSCTGFLKISNRICVALSRAKKGFYAIGNAKLLASAPIWAGILDGLRMQNCLKPSLPLQCQIHRSRAMISKGSDFEQVAPDGGCSLPCDTHLDCGHVCRLWCHPFDRNHEEYRCYKPCQRIHKNCGHACPKVCYEDCDVCTVMVDKTMPNCGHVHTMECHFDPNLFECQEYVQRILPCGHEKQLLCCQNTFTICSFVECLQMETPYLCEEYVHCEIQVDATLPCGHQQNVKCYQKNCKELCKSPCEQRLPCGHACDKKCGQTCVVDCAVKVDATLPCGHQQNVKCYQKNCGEVCKWPCEHHLQCGHACDKKCGQTCVVDCAVKVDATLPCGHQQNVKCYQKNCGEVCKWPCEHHLPCGHACDKKCGQTCVVDCAVTVDATLPCGHKQEVMCYQKNSTYICEWPCERQLVCGHKCDKKCGQKCTEQCQHPINATLSCGHKENVLCFQQNNSEKCTSPCDKLLPCGHICKGKCKDKCSPYCFEVVDFTLPCGHQMELKCFMSQLKNNCPHPCSRILSCGHRCTLRCRQPCTKLCRIQKEVMLTCGHQKEIKCFEEGLPLKCFRPCMRLQKPCGHPCLKICHDECGDCTVEVTRIMLNCGHLQTMSCHQELEFFDCKEEGCCNSPM
uniref:NFX1-type zinc finger-containing protein 1-like n=1 Tax=Myxine glutinosa TaxID=7769 RepID=UPI00358EECEB